MFAELHKFLPLANVNANMAKQRNQINKILPKFGYILILDRIF